MSYSVVCVEEFVGMTSDGRMISAPLPRKDSVYTCVSEKFDAVGMHSLKLAEMGSWWYNSDYFVPVDPIERTNVVSIEEMV